MGEISFSGALQCLKSSGDARYLNYVWRASGDFAQSCWNVVYEAFGSNEFALYVWGTSIFTFSVYWILALCYSFIDWTGRPAFALKYKIQDTSSFPMSFGKVVKQVLFNQVFVGIPLSVLWYYLMNWRGCDSGKDISPFCIIVLEIVFFGLMQEFGLYYSHRLLHHRRIYKYIHKRHHEWTSPIAISAFYCHPVEYLFSNLIPMLIGPFLLGSHLFTFWLWVGLGLFISLHTHSGFHFPFLLSPEAHDFHHLKFNENFGSLGLLDRLHGTDSEFLKSKAHQRHFLSTSLVPVKQLYPDK